MANLVITNSNFTAGSTIVASQFNTNFSDISSYINVRNAGTTAWDALTVPAATVTNTSNQLILGTTTTTTISASAPASSSVYTIPDMGTTANFVLSEGAQTINGVKTLGSQLILNGTTNQLRLNSVGAANLVITSASIATTDRTVTIPDPGAAASFVLTQGTQTIAGATTFSGNTSIANTKFQVGGNQAFPIVQIVTATSTTAKSTSSSTYAATNLTATITPKFNTSKILIMANGSLLSTGNGIYAFATLARGGSNLLGTDGGAVCGSTTTNIGYVTPVSLTFYDSPGSTSALTYAVYLKNSDNSTSVSFGSSQNATLTQHITLIEFAQ